jgi:hypothetical protein
LLAACRDQMLHPDGNGLAMVTNPAADKLIV